MSLHNFRVNLNGSSAEALKEQHLKVLHAVWALDKAMGEATPHGRDYQTLGSEAMNLCVKDKATLIALRQSLRGIEQWAEEGAMRANEQGGR